MKFVPTCILFLCFLASGLVGCVPDRKPVELACKNDSQCPADGKTFCDLSVGLCAPCQGVCPAAQEASAASSTDTSSGSAASDAWSTLDSSSTRTTSDTTVNDQTDASMDASADDAEEIVSCIGQCGEFLGEDSPCNCDYMCADFEDCCPDFQIVCGALMDADADASTSIPDASSMTEAP